MIINMSPYEAIRNCEEKIHRLEIVSGYSIDQLISLFAAGYTLKGPESNQETLEKFDTKLVKSCNSMSLTKEEIRAISRGFVEEKMGGKKHV